jgi:predicted nucleic acid-binding protein
LSIVSGDLPRELVLDAGPLIALLYQPDAQHADAEHGYRQLVQARTELIAPLPVVFEVYKRLAYDAHPGIARLALEQMRDSLDIRYSRPDHLDEIVDVLDSMPAWPGSLEDALVAVVALQLDVPVWTFNYRDLAAFPNLRFWTPAPA